MGFNSKLRRLKPSKFNGFEKGNFWKIWFFKIFINILIKLLCSIYHDVEKKEVTLRGYYFANYKIMNGGEFYDYIKRIK